MLFERQVTHLDRLSAAVRRTRGTPMNRAAIIRGLIDGLINSGVDLTNYASEATLRTYVAERLKPSPIW